MPGNSILPSGETLHVAPGEIKRYSDPDTLRQMFRQERLRWNLKPNRKSDYYSNTTLHKFSSDLHNDGLYQRMEIRTFPDNKGFAGYTGIYNDSGENGFVHNVELWDHALTEESLKQLVNRTYIGSLAKIPGRIGYGLNDENEIDARTDNRQTGFIFDPWDGRAYYLSNDDPHYVNNETRDPSTKLPWRSVATVGMIPTRLTHLKNDLDFISDPDYHHTDFNFTNSHKFILENIDDRTFVYPEISRDRDGHYIDNTRIGLSGEPDYAESDGYNKYNTQPDLGLNPDLGDHGDRFGEAINSYNANSRFSGVDHKDGYLPGIFRSLEELERVDLVDQKRNVLTHEESPGGRRSYNYYQFDGIWSPTWFDRYQYNESYLAQSLNPVNMEIEIDGREPVPYSRISQTDKYRTDQLYQWRYNRVSIEYHTDDISITIVDSGENYAIGEILRWTFGDDVILYKVLLISINGQIMKGEYVNTSSRIFEQNPSTHGVGIPFTDTSGVGRGAKLAVYCKATLKTHATQIKNNLYAYVDITPSIRSDNSTVWSDTNPPSTQNGKIVVRSTASSPSYSGVNSGRGGPSPLTINSDVKYYEHGGNATAGVHVHLFRYVINTQNPTWIIRDDIQVFTGRWVDQGPMGVERPCDIKALLFSNPDTNNFNNYYKFMVDILLDSINRNPDGVITGNDNTLSQMYLHKAQRDPKPDQRFYMEKINPDTSKVESIDVTDKVMYINCASGVIFFYNPELKMDEEYGYGRRLPGWFSPGGYITR